MSFIGKLLPIHGYRVLVSDHLTKNYQLSLSHLYQPLIGMQAIMLYQTLLNEHALSTEQMIRTHHSLMNYLDCPLDVIYENRLKLEAIGLVKTYEATDEEKTVFTYALQRPFAPDEFFHDPMLSELLYHHLGDKMFGQLKEQFVKKSIVHLDEKEVTANFSDVFTTIKPNLHESKSMPNNHLKQMKRPDVTNEFTNIATTLKQRHIPPQQVLTPANRRLISDMMRLYHLTEYDVEKCVLWALREDHRLDHEEFKAACHDLFKTERNAFIRLQNKHNKHNEKSLESTSTQKTEEKSKKDQLSERLETISLRQLLEGFTDGQASEKDLKMIGEIMRANRLKPPVMNVLVHYVLMQSNRKLTREYLEAIASHWARLQLKTAREAMDFVQKEIEKAQQRKNRRRTKRMKQQEIIPEWFKQQKQARKQSAQQTSEQKQASSYDEAEILALFHKHSSENKNKQG